MATIEPWTDDSPARLSALVKSLLHTNRVVAFPTETFYGLGVDPFERRAVEQLLELKGSRDGKPILVLIGERKQLGLFTPALSPATEALIEACWPGPLTLVLPAAPSLPENLTGGSGSIGVRWTSHRRLAALLRVVGPMTGTSANRSGAAPANTAEEVEAALGAAVDLILDGGRTAGGLPSTVFDVRPPLRMIREGAVTRQMIQNVLEKRGVEWQG